MSTCVIALLAASLMCLAAILYLDRVKIPSPEGFQMAIPNTLMSSFNGGDVDYFPTIKRDYIMGPDGDKIRGLFRDCVDSGRDTVKGCLTSSGAGYRPGICMQLCATEYGDMSKYCSKVCNDQQTQVNTSARFGPS